jgi:hypothetical protein
MGDRCKGSLIVLRQDQPADFVVVGCDDRLLEKAAQGQIGQGHLCGHALGLGVGGHAGEQVARSHRAGLGQQGPEVGEGESVCTDGVGIGHGGLVCAADLTGRAHIVLCVAMLIVGTSRSPQDRIAPGGSLYSSARPPEV